MSHIVEIIRMKMRQGVGEDEVLAASERANELFRRMPGLLRRTLLGPDGQGMWTDISEFADLPSVERAKTIAHEQPGDASVYFGLVEKASLAYERLEVKTQLAESAVSS